ncbi:O-antigen ligase family protein [Halococcus sp. PRR34]|uniref:O-antigen ligase family protein n=1 Tax=Halococcus sp. PRR34 TaxID=3020830 RepID=UPI00235F7760|nr:O-antigen ligase family protein [Halococcus sp. PRR34]
MIRADTFWIGLLLLTSSLSVTTLIPELVGYVIILSAYMVFVGVLLVTDRFAVVYHWAIVPMIVLTWTVFALTTVLDPTGAGIIRLGAFVVITGINLFVVPAVIDRAALHDVIAYTAGVSILIGLPTVIFGAYEIAGLTISPWHTSHELFGISLNTLRSVFSNPNTLTGFSALGTVAAGAGFVRSHGALTAGLVGLNALGAYLASGRAGLLALIVAGVLYVVYRLLGRIALAGLVGAGALTVVAGFAMALGIVPGPSAVSHVDLSSRRAIWTAAYEAILNRPAIGWGPGKDKTVLARYIGESSPVRGTHNSYIRMFLIGGLLGGGAYLAITISTVMIGLQNADSETLFTFLLLIMFLIMQIFEGMTIFGLSLFSTLGAFFVGYIQASSTISKVVVFDIHKLVPRLGR